MIQRLLMVAIVGTVITGMGLGFASSGLTVTAQNIDAGQDDTIGIADTVNVDFTIASGSSQKITACVVEFDDALPNPTNVTCELLNAGSLVAIGNATLAGLAANTPTSIPILTPVGGFDISSATITEVEILVKGPATT